MKAPAFLRRRRLRARIDRELEQLRPAAGGAGLAVFASNRFNPQAVGTVLGLARRIRLLEQRRAAL